MGQSEFDGFGNKAEQKNLVNIYLQDMALRVLRGSFSGIWIVVTMNNVIFSQIQVEKWARDSFFFLSESFPFDESNFGELQEQVAFKKSMVIRQAVSYVFHLRQLYAKY